MSNFSRKTEIVSLVFLFASRTYSCLCLIKWASQVALVVKKKNKNKNKKPSCQCRKYKRHGFDPWVRKIPWRRAWQPTPVSLPGESHGQRSLAGYSPWESELDLTEVTQHFVHTKGYRIDQPQAWGSAVSTRWVKLGDGCGKGRERNQVDSWLSDAGQKKQPFAE